MHEALLGRDELLADALSAPAGVLVHGSAGIGKTAVLEALADRGRAEGHRVLRAGPARAEQDFPHVALMDLFGALLPEAAGRLAPALRQALESALLRGEREAYGPAADPLAVRVAVVELLRLLAGRGPVLVLIDDAQWLDAASRDVLAFAARRADPQVRVMVTERTGPGEEPSAHGLCPPPVTELALPGLSLEHTGALLRRRLGVRLPAPTVRRVHRASAGNALFALELGRALVRQSAPVHPGEPLPVPRRLRTLLADRLAGLPAHARGPLLRVAAAARPGVALFADDGEALTTAVEQGILVRGRQGEVRFRHPLLAEILHADARAEEVAAAHAYLARIEPDPVGRARHRALAAAGPDPALAEELMAAARTADGRGAPAAAAELAELAARHTPGDPATAARRTLAATRYAASAGLTDLARDLGHRALASPEAATRVHARLELVRLAGSGREADVGPLLAAAAADARGDAGLDAAVRLERARRALRDADGERGLVELAAAERRARDAGDPELLAEILGLVGIVTMQNDPAQALRTLDEALGLAAGLPLCPATVTVRLSWSVAQARDGRVSPAVAVLEALREEAEAAGCVQQLCTVLYVAAAVNSRAGRCRQAAQHARTAAELRAASEPGPGPALAMRGVAELEAGSAPAAARHLDAAVERCTAAEDTEWLAYSLGWRGRARLLLGRYADAAEDLERCRALLDSLGFVDPALFLADADLVESLALAGRHGPARRALARARDRVAALDRHVVTLGLDRAEAVLVGESDPRRAAEMLQAALPASHPYPLEPARALLTLGRLQRRARRRAAARASLEQAAALFRAADGAPWVAAAQEALAETDALDRPDDDVDAHIIGLVRQNATNREIAARLHMSVKAVEAKLTRIYRRHGVQGRRQLASLDVGSD